MLGLGVVWGVQVLLVSELWDNLRTMGSLPSQKKLGKWLFS